MGRCRHYKARARVSSVSVELCTKSVTLILCKVNGVFFSHAMLDCYWRPQSTIENCPSIHSTCIQFSSYKMVFTHIIGEKKDQKVKDRGGLEP